MFGRTPKLPTDSMFETAAEDMSSRTTTEYITELKNTMETAREIVNKHTGKARGKQTHFYDRKAKASRLEVGDKVLIKVLAFEGKHKLANKFEDEECVIVEQPNVDIPVFKVKSSDGRLRTLHRNNLLALGTIHSGPKETTVVIDDDTNSREEENLETAAACKLDTQDFTDSLNRERDYSDSGESEEDIELTSVHEDAHTSGKPEKSVKELYSREDTSLDGKKDDLVNTE